ncbi:YjcZ family sporulation protein [Bacillus sp. ISL-75]|nr:YjcZ family sporulation protein [Bacillus sp. ISL-75]MBT2730810.1 YjcZ family sporulation protein [Bacillus sp. ISL-75]
MLGYCGYGYGGYGYGEYGYGDRSTFVLIVVLFMLLIIVGASWF